MNKKVITALWGGLFIVCAGLGFIPEPEGTIRILLTILSLLFFLPPAWLLYDAGKRQDKAGLQLIRNLSALSLGLTLGLLILNFLVAFGAEAAGTMLYVMLVIVSSPMVCSGYWALSLFFWACLLMASLRR